MFGRTVFSIGDQTFLTDDLICAALGSGRWDGLRRHVRALLEAERELGGVEDERLEAAADESAATFRYDRDLISAADTERWLEQREMTVDEWFDGLRRRLLAKFTLTRPLPPSPPDPPEMLKAIWVEFVVSGLARELSRQLARQAAAHGLAADLAPPPPVDEAALAQELELVRQHFPGFDPEATRERLRRLELLGSALSRVMAAAVSPEAVRREIEHRVLDLLRLECEVVRFEDEPHAREAVLCVKEDGLALAEAAEEAHAEVEELELWIDELPAELRTTLRSASVGELLGPLDWEGTPVLVLLKGKRRPSAEDPEVWTRAERGLLDRLLAERLENQVSWTLPF